MHTRVPLAAAARMLPVAAPCTRVQQRRVHRPQPRAATVPGRARRGLVLQDLSAMRPAAERAAYLRHSLSKFRRALRLRPDFDRAVYNLGAWGRQKHAGGAANEMGLIACRDALHGCLRGGVHAAAPAAHLCVA